MFKFKVENKQDTLSWRCFCLIARACYLNYDLCRKMCRLVLYKDWYGFGNNFLQMGFKIWISVLKP